MERRLAAVPISDVAGYSHHMEVDEEETLRRLQADLRELFVPKIAEHRGRLVKTTGDGLVAEFHSVVDAVRCAVDVQNVKARRDADIAADCRLAYRIGVNLGDVIIDGGDIYGDGVNIAARLQSLAAASDVMISGTVYDHVEKKLPLGFEFQGERQVKNIDKPVRVYRVLIDPAVAGKTIDLATTPRQRWRRPAIAIGMFLVVIAAGAAAWFHLWAPRFEPALPLPDKPSIAVLPFTNASGDPKQEYFADGIADDLITDLSRIPDLFVIARNSTFAYKGRAVNAREVAQELGVRYVLHGSIQRAGDQVRINVQLIDAVTGDHRWSERYDGSITDVFALQDKVTSAIADALALRLANAERVAVHGRETRVPAAYEAFLQGWTHYRRMTPDGFVNSIPHFEKAIELDPNYGRAYGALALVYAQNYIWRWAYRLGIPASDARATAREYLLEARKRPTTLAHLAAGILLQSDWSHAQALAEIKEAIALEPGEPWSYALMSWILTSAGRSEEALLHIRTAIRLHPHFPSFFMFLLGLAQFGLGQFEEAAAPVERATKLNPDDEGSFLLLGATYGHLGRQKEAASAIARYNEIMIGQRGDMAVTMATAPPLDFSQFAQRERLREGLRLAGVPESLSSDEFGADIRLTAEETRKLFLGHRLQGHIFATGDEHAATITLDGIVTMSGDWGSVRNAHVKFDSTETCFVRSGGITFCGTVLRNPGGTRALENELIWIDNRGGFTFSQVE